jgi:hypothetical protein
MAFSYGKGRLQAGHEINRIFSEGVPNRDSFFDVVIIGEKSDS